MLRSIYVSLFLSCICALNAQKITPTVLANAGDVGKSGNFTLEWTLGEIATETLKSNSNVITQGFHQTNLTIVSTNNPSIIGLKVYPNPVEDQLIIENQSGKNVAFHVFNLTGQCIIEQTYSPGLQNMNLNLLPSGSYILEAISDNQKQKFTIEKIK